MFGIFIARINVLICILLAVLRKFLGHLKSLYKIFSRNLSNVSIVGLAALYQKNDFGKHYVKFRIFCKIMQMFYLIFCISIVSQVQHLTAQKWNCLKYLFIWKIASFFRLFAIELQMKISVNDSWCKISIR